MSNRCSHHGRNNIVDQQCFLLDKQASLVLGEAYTLNPKPRLLPKPLRNERLGLESSQHVETEEFYILLVSGFWL